MIGSLNTQNRTATVVGAGISGLLASYYLDVAGFEVTLLEAKEKTGGLISTQKKDFGISETAAHSFLATPQVLKLCHHLEVELLPVKNSARYVLRDGKMKRFPLTFLETIEVFYRACFVPANRLGPQTMEEWAKRHLGKKATDYLISPFLAGIYAAVPNEISVGTAFPRLEIKPPHSLFTWWLSHMRQTKHSSTMMAPKKGMGDLVEKLTLHLERKLKNRFKKAIEVSSLPDTANVILCTNAHQAAIILKSQDHDLSQSLEQIHYTPLVSATVFIEKKAFPKEPCGIGVLMPVKEKRRCLGVLFNSSAFDNRVEDQEHMISMTIMMGGSENLEIVNATDEQIQKQISEELKTIFNINQPPVHIEIHRHPKAIPQYSLHLRKTLEVAKQRWCGKPGRLLFGNYTGQISIRGMTEAAEMLAPKTL